MGINSDIISEKAIVKRIGKSIVLSEYAAGRYKYANIVVDRCTNSITKIFPEIFNYLFENKLVILNQFLFGKGKHELENKKNSEKYLRGIKWPVTIIKQESLNGGYEWGTIIAAVSATNLQPVFEGETIIGNYFEDDYAKHFFFGGLIPEISGQSNIGQSKQSFEMIDTILGKAGMEIGNVTRTWFYLNDLLNWYDEFNTVRNDYFTSKGIYEKLIPASTGIGAENLNNGAVLFGGYAVKQIQKIIKIKSVESPLQCPASDYKSSFSRAVEISHPDYRHIIVSGTASITPDGETANAGNINKQVELTMKVVNAILQSRDMSWENVTRGIVYFKNKKEINSFDDYCTTNSMPLLPLSIIQADICREELLFEIEIDAVSVNKCN
jgi:enamine deaminase RidA (YjgF/YER057c/UK114 family)